MGVRDSLFRGATWLLQPRGASAPSPAYDAAGTGVRTMGWDASSAALSSIIAAAGPNLTRRSRDVVRKNPWAENALDKYVANSIGTGVKPQPTHPDEGERRKLKDGFSRFADESDARGVTHFYGQQVQAARSAMEGGDCFARLRSRRPEDGLYVPFQIELHEAEMVPWDKSERRSPATIVRCGIESTLGRPVAYHMYQDHPGDFMFARGLATSRVPARDVAHVFKPLRPGQIRGVPGLASVLLRLYELDLYEDAQLKVMQIASQLTGFITKAPGANTAPPLSQGGAQTDPVNAAIEYVRLMTGTFQVLRDGEDVTMAKAADIGAGAPDFVKHMLRSAAAGSGTTYEQLTGDLSGVNYSSIRAGLLEFRREVEQYVNCFFIFQFCRPIWRRFIEESVLAGHIDLASFRRDPAAYYGCRWVPQGFKWVDPLKEVTALVLAIRAGLISWEDAVQQSGGDPSVTEQQLAAEMRRHDALGIKRDSDARRPLKGGGAATGSGNGGARDAAAPAADEDDEDDEDAAQSDAA